MKKWSYQNSFGVCDASSEKDVLADFADFLKHSKEMLIYCEYLET